MSHVFTVRELTWAIKEALEGQFPFIWVRGQASGVSRPSSGHVYFSLKDQDAVLGVVWFRGSHDNAGVVGAARPGDIADGQELLVAGRLAVYPPRGAYQLVAELVQDQGVGRLHVEFEALKERLAARGFFEIERKRALPALPTRVAVVTAPTGAAIRDFLRVGETRGVASVVRVYASPVQGEGAAERLAAQLDLISAEGWAEVAVLIRGGGSMEDLWSFNSEVLAEAVYRCRMPVLAGVGHEVDVTIADLVADVRAATPSHAAQLLWPERRGLVERLGVLEGGLSRAADRLLSGREGELASLERTLGHLSPEARLKRLMDEYDREAAGLGRAVEVFLDRKGVGLHNALGALLRGLTAEDVELRRAGLDLLSERLGSAFGRSLKAKGTGLDVCEAKLSALDPEAPLKRGYGLVRVERTGRFLRHPREVGPGDGLDIQVRDGRLRAVVADEAERMGKS